jgi:hypothetical protein
MHQSMKILVYWPKELLEMKLGVVSIMHYANENWKSEYRDYLYLLGPNG